MLAGSTISDLVYVEPGFYNELKAEIAPVLDSNYSVYIEARYTDSLNETHPVIFRTSESIEFEIENEQGIQVNDQDIKDLLVRIDLQSLFGSVDPNSASVDESGTILLSTGSIMKNWLNSLKSSWKITLNSGKKRMTTMTTMKRMRTMVMRKRTMTMIPKGIEHAREKIAALIHAEYQA